MKLNWFSPLPPDHTEIANVTARMLPALAKAFDLSVYTERAQWSESLNAVCQIEHFKAHALDWKKLHHGGIPVYHIGNNIHFHGEIIHAARKCPGIVVLHDLRLHETIMNFCLYKGAGRTGYFDILHKYGGPEAVDLGIRYLEEHQPDIATISGQYPLFEYVLENAIGVITYNPLNVPPVRKATPAPVLYSPLPFLSKAELQPRISRAKRHDGVYKILIFGFLGGPNRRLRPFLEAFSKSEVQSSFEILLAGKYPEADLKAWIKELGIGDRVTLKGFLSDDDLDGLLRESDLTINLRWPSMGESSATLLRVWNYSLPSLVTDTAFYSTLPSEVVAFVDPQEEERDILKHLSAFSDNPEPYFEMGLKGRGLLESQHSVEASIDHLKSFLPEVVRWQGNVQAQTFGINLAGDFLSDYPEGPVKTALVQSCADEIATWS